MTNLAILYKYHSHSSFICHFTCFYITEDMIIKAINELDTKAAVGPYGILAKLLKICKSVLAKPLGILWNASIRQGRIPKIFKHAFIIPILKPCQEILYWFVYSRISGRVGLSLIKTFKFKEYKGYTNYKGAHASSSPLKEVSLEVEASDKSNLFVAYREGYNWTHKGGGSLRFAG